MPVPADAILGLLFLVIEAVGDPNNEVLKQNQAKCRELGGQPVVELMEWKNHDNVAFIGRSLFCWVPLEEHEAQRRQLAGNHNLPPSY